ncbi:MULTISPECIES: LuxR C-terminal-related transcriptional regulator [unclassified Azospirillum]|uniref:helix-turn-helix domain-containing protein n=1 Tax=unclassified Azospirillum TaxID=2630922 RepID=UPI001304A012|nr:MULTISPECIES: LuxR C-terminal-related transcriptional regulator [unclassified Azospirillum]
MLMTRTRPEQGRGGAYDAARQPSREQVLEAIDVLWECFRELTANNSGDAERRLASLGKFATALSTITQQAPILHPTYSDAFASDPRNNDAFGNVNTSGRDLSGPNKSMFVQLTPKQHAVIQMMLRGASNVEIAKRLGWSESTAKGAIHNLARKFLAPIGATRYDRAGLDNVVRPIYEAMGPQEYEHVATFPKTWDARWTEADIAIRPYLYEKRVK